METSAVTIITNVAINCFNSIVMTVLEMTINRTLMMVDLKYSEEQVSASRK